jgi:phosphate ABC transporter phosphate-binding protein
MLSRKSQTLIQYFERAVFEYHPENQPPYNVLLAQLGRFRYDAFYSKPKYPGVDTKITLNGAGATDPEPLIARWRQEYNKQYGNIKLNYQGVGSGSGKSQFINRTIDYAGSDLPMTDEQFARAGGLDNAMHIPITMRAVAIAYNVPGIYSQLKLTGPVLANIFLCKITNWNDPSIAAINPGVQLPNLPIITAHYSDSRGTNDTFTDYLSRVSPEFSARVGHNALPNWPCGIGNQGEVSPPKW